MRRRETYSPLWSWWQGLWTDRWSGTLSFPDHSRRAISPLHERDFEAAELPSWLAAYNVSPSIYRLAIFFFPKTRFFSMERADLSKRRSLPSGLLRILNPDNHGYHRDVQRNLVLEAVLRIGGGYYISSSLHHFMPDI